MENLLVKKFIKINSITLLFVYILYSMSIPYMIRLSIGEVDTKYIAIYSLCNWVFDIIVINLHITRVKYEDYVDIIHRVGYIR